MEKKKEIREADESKKESESKEEKDVEKSFKTLVWIDKLMSREVSGIL